MRGAFRGVQGVTGRVARGGGRCTSWPLGVQQSHAARRWAGIHCKQATHNKLASSARYQGTRDYVIAHDT